MSATLAAFGLLLLVAGPHLVTLFRDSTLAGCHSNCAPAAGDVLSSPAIGTTYHLVYLLGLC